MPQIPFFELSNRSLLPPPLSATSACCDLNAILLAISTAYSILPPDGISDAFECCAVIYRSQSLPETNMMPEEWTDPTSIFINLSKIWGVLSVISDIVQPGWKLHK